MKKVKGIIASVLIGALVITSSYAYANNEKIDSSKTILSKGVKKIKLSKKKVKIAIGKKNKVKVKGKYGKIKLKVAKKKIVKATVKGKNIIIKGKKKGKTSVIVKAYKKGKLCAKAKIKVTVKAKASSAGSGSNSNSSSTNSGNSTKPSDKTKNADAGEYSINKVHEGYATYYDRESTGAANLDDYEGEYYTAAMNNYDYMNGLAGAYVEVTDKDGDKIKVLITDRLPEGAKGDIDLSRKAFKKIEPEVTGKMKITWKIIAFPTSDPISFRWKPTSTQYWAEIQVRNGRYPIKSLEYYDKAKGKYVELERQEYNYFTAPSGMGNGPYKFRVKDFYGHTIIENNISIRTDDVPVKGSKNFDY